jgi:hypothetical protein
MGSNPPANGARSKAQSHFETAEARNNLVKKIIDAERAAVDAKTAKLRALRLAKEEADRLEAEKLEAEKPVKKKRVVPAKAKKAV